MTLPRLIVHCFPGFLGQPQDLEFLRVHLSEIRGLPLEWRFCLADPLDGEGWNEWSRRWLMENPLSSDGARHAEALLGYSLGGRAAAHLALAAPERFRGLIAISANPGLPAVSERDARLAADEAWARRFETETWDALLADWNVQAVFQGAGLPDRLRERETRGSPDLRARCARQLRQFSLGRQEDLASGLLQLQKGQVWITGERDSKFTEITRRLVGSTLIRREVVPGAGHRWPWELSETDAAGVIRNALDFLVKQDSR